MTNEESAIMFENQKEELEKYSPDTYKSAWEYWCNIIKKQIGGYK